MNLKHHFLIAMPGLQDPFFKRSVIYICEHNIEGAMGLMINKPLENLTIGTMLQKLQIELVDPQIKLNHLDNFDLSNRVVFVGGPISCDRGFIIHSGKQSYSSSIPVSQETIITTSRDILEFIGTMRQPKNIFVALGYCAWKANQLDNELLENIWLTVPADINIIFSTPIINRWYEAAKIIGVDIYNVNYYAGHA